MKQVEFLLCGYTVHVFMEGEALGTCGSLDVGKICRTISKRLEQQYSDNCTIFMMGDRQIEKVKEQLEKLKRG